LAAINARRNIMAIYEPEIHEQVAPEMLEPWRAVMEKPPERSLPNGPAAAAILASGIGSALYGVIVLLAESVPAVHDFTNLNSDVGPLSGKTTFGVLAWLIVWGALHALWRRKNVGFARVFTATLVLIGLALALTFPPVFLAFAID
jgi:hypothetical protein